MTRQTLGTNLNESSSTGTDWSYTNEVALCSAFLAIICSSKARTAFPVTWCALIIQSIESASSKASRVRWITKSTWWCCSTACTHSWECRRLLCPAEHGALQPYQLYHSSEVVTNLIWNSPCLDIFEITGDSQSGCESSVDIYLDLRTWDFFRGRGINVVFDNRDCQIPPARVWNPVIAVSYTHLTLPTKRIV